MSDESTPSATGPSASKQLLGRGSIYTLATAAPMLAGLVITPALTRGLVQTEYGQVSLGITAMQFTFNLLAMGLPTAITRHAITESDGPEQARGIATRGALIALAISAVVCGLGLGLVQSGRDIPIALLLGVFTGGAGAGVAMAQALSLAEDQPWRYVGLAFGMSLLAPAAGLLAVFTLSATSTAYYTAVFVVYLLVDIYAYLRIMATRQVRFVRSAFREALGIALPMIPHQLAIGTTTAAAIWVVTARVGVDAAAEAQPSLQLATMALAVTSALSYAWTPIVLKASADDQQRLLEETSSVVVWLAALGGAVVALTAPWVLRFLAPFDLSEMVPLTALTSLTPAIAGAYLAHLQLVFAAGATRPLAIMSPTALGLGAAAGWLLVPLLGLAALGIGYVVTYSCLFIFTRLVARRAQQVRWSERGLVVPVLVGAAACMVGALLSWHSVLEIVVRITLAAMATAMAGYLFISRQRGRAQPNQPNVEDGAV